MMGAKTVCWDSVPGCVEKGFVIVGFELVYMDDFIDELLHEERCCDVILPRIQVRIYICTDYVSLPCQSCLLNFGHRAFSAMSVSIGAGSPLSPSRQRPQTGPFAVPRIYP